jgi:hypothetical protein
MSGNSKEEKELPYHPAFDEFMKLNPPCLVRDQAKNFYTTSEIKTMVNEIAFDADLDDTKLLGLLIGYDYQMVNLAPGISRWMFN